MDEGCKCQECGRQYRVDFMVPDYLWEQIKPEGKPEGAGLLCGLCIAERIEDRQQFGAYELADPRPPIITFIQTIRDSFEGSEYVYQNGSCYYFAKILQLMYPGGELWEFQHEHVIYKYEGKYYDIRGEVHVDGQFSHRPVVPSQEPTPHGKFSLIDFMLTKKF